MREPGDRKLSRPVLKRGKAISLTYPMGTTKRKGED